MWAKHGGGIEGFLFRPVKSHHSPFRAASQIRISPSAGVSVSPRSDPSEQICASESHPEPYARSPMRLALIHSADLEFTGWEIHPN